MTDLPAVGERRHPDCLICRRLGDHESCFARDDPHAWCECPDCKWLTEENDDR